MAVSDIARPELPGYTYDEERRRYIKILADHHAGVLGGAAGAASVSAVRDVNAFKKRRKIEDEQMASVSKLQIQRSKLHKHAIIGMSLDRQIGVQKCFPDVLGEAWAQLIDPTWTAPSYYNSSWYMMKKTVQDDAFIGVLHHSGASLASSKLKIMFSNSPRRASRYYPAEASFSRASSINLTEKYAFLTTFHRNEPNRLFEIPKALSEVSDIPENYYTISKADDRHDYWCTSFHPDVSQPRIAVGSEHSVLVHNPFCSHGHGLTEYKTPTTSSPVLSIQWRSENIIAAGLRDNTVHLYDVRARDDVYRLRHGQAVMRLHCPDEHKLLLGGPKQLSMYDLRYNKIPHQKRTSRPWLYYRNYDNTRWAAYDMDISPRLGLLALALETTTEIWNLWTGAKIRQLCSTPASSKSIEKSNVVTFTRPHHKPHFFAEESDPQGLLVANPNSAQEWRLEGKVGIDSEDVPSSTIFSPRYRPL